MIILLILLIRPDSIGTFTTILVAVLWLAATAAGTFYVPGKTNEKLETAERQTNDTLSAPRRSDRLARENVERGKPLPPPIDD